MKFPLYPLALLSLLTFSCGKKTTTEGSAVSTSEKKSSIKSEELSYGINGVTHRSFAAYNRDLPGPLPVVFVLPEWWGLNAYIKDRTVQLAELGYYAVAVDYYGEGKVVQTPEEAQKLSSHFYKIPIDARRMFDAAKNRVIISENADHTRMAIIGYCFGGAQALNMGRTYSDFKGVVSFHGNLKTGIRAKNNKVKYLVLNGAADNFVSEEEIKGFKKEMDSARIDYRFVNYPGALHAFTNPTSTATGKKFNIPIAYDRDADQKSWKKMAAFLADVLK